MADINLNFGTEELDNLKKLLDAIVKQVDEIRKTMSQTGFGTEEDLNKIKKLEVEAAKLALQKERIERSKAKQAEQDQRAVNKAREQSGIIGTLERQVKEYTAAWKGANTEAEKKAAKRNLDEIKKKLSEAKEVTDGWGKALGSFQFKFNALGNIAANVVAKGFRMMNNAMRDSVKIVLNFNEAQTTLQALSGKTKAGIKVLTDQAKQLGAQTRFTATEVTNLQIELAKLGFSINEISSSTPGILKFASATGANLADAAKVAGIAVRAFGLSTAETETAVATLAVSTTKSALQFSDFETILSTVGPVARSFGFTLQDTIGLLGKLRDAGFDASTASTATRNIFLNLANSTGKLAQELGKTPKTFNELIEGLVTLRGKGIDLNETLQLTDKRSVAAFNQFLQTAEGAKSFRDSITGVNDELDIMVETRLKSLNGQLDLLKSAWEGFILSIEQGDGAISKLVTGSLSILTDALTQLSNLDLIWTRTSKQTEEQLERTFDVLMNFTRAGEGKAFQGVIDQFNAVNFVLIKFDETVRSNFIKTMKDAGFTSFQAAKMWDVYVGRREKQFETELEAQKAYEKRKTEAIVNEQKIRDRSGIRTAQPLNLEENFKDAELEFDEFITPILNFWKKDLPEAHKWATDEMIDGVHRFYDENKKVSDQLEQDRKAEIELTRQRKMNELMIYADFFNALAVMSSENSNFLKALAIAEGTLNAIVAAIDAMRQQKAGTIGKLAAYAVILTAGLTAVGRIKAVSMPKMAEGGEIGGRPHSQGGTLIEAEKGEFMIRKSAYQKNKALVHAINSDDNRAIMEMLHRDRKIILHNDKDYTKKLYDLLSNQEHGYETKEFYVIQKGNTKIKLHKN